MKFRFKPTNKRFTILIVPEGTSPVFRFKLKLSLLLTSVVAVGSMAVLLLVLFIVNRNHSDRIASLQAELSLSNDQLQSTIDNKEQNVDKLLSELLELSEKSKDIESKINELEKIESELKSLGGMSGLSSDLTALLPLSDGGIGGEDVPLTEDEIVSLAAEAKDNLSATLDKMPNLQAKLDQTKGNLQKYKQWLKILPTYWPTTSVRTTSDFGKRIDPFNGKITLHNGLDIGGDVGDPIYAAADGKVTDTGYSPARGNYVTLSHPSGTESIYMHLKRSLANKGDNVKQGDLIGELGNTGRSTGPHLHFQVMKNGTAVDPLLYLKIPGEDDRN